MVALEDFVALNYRSTHCLKYLVAFLKIKRCIRVEFDSLLVASCRFRIILGMQPMCPSEVSPCKVICRIHLDAFFPLLHRIVRLDVVEEVTEIVIWLCRLRAYLLSFCKNIDSLKAEWRTVSWVKRKSILVILLASCEITEIKFYSRICYSRIDVLEDLYSSVLETIVPIKDCKLKV